MFQTIRFIGLATLLFSVAACGGHKHRPQTQTERWQSMGFQAGLKNSTAP